MVVGTVGVGAVDDEGQRFSIAAVDDEGQRFLTATLQSIREGFRKDILAEIDYQLAYDDYQVAKEAKDGRKLDIKLETFEHSVRDASKKSLNKLREDMIMRVTAAAIQSPDLKALIRSTNTKQLCAKVDLTRVKHAVNQSKINHAQMHNLIAASFKKAIVKEAKIVDLTDDDDAETGHGRKRSRLTDKSEPAAIARLSKRPRKEGFRVEMTRLEHDAQNFWTATSH